MAVSDTRVVEVMGATFPVTAAAPDPPSAVSRLLSGFTPPQLPPISRRAFRFHMAFALLDAVFAGIMGNAPLMAVKAMSATDVQLQLPIAMTSVGLFASVFLGAAMATRRKKPFVLVPGSGRGVLRAPDGLDEFGRLVPGHRRSDFDFRFRHASGGAFHLADRLPGLLPVPRGRHDAAVRVRSFFGRDAALRVAPGGGCAPGTPSDTAATYLRRAGEHGRLGLLPPTSRPG